MTTATAMTTRKPEKLGDRLAPTVIAAMNRGDQGGVLQALAWGLEPDAPDYWQVIAGRAAEIALEIRRASIAVINDHEAFVRKTPDGSLLRVVQPVVLSIADGTLYQIVKNVPYLNGQRYRGRNAYGKDGIEWREEPMGDPHKATVTYPGFIAMNAVAGCAVGQPPTVYVDGEPKTNPYVERWTDRDGRKRDIVRIVLAICVVGPAPATGNPTVVNYTLDYDPTKDLASMLDEVADTANNSEDCYLVPEKVADAEIKGDKKGWSFLPIVGGVGWLHNLRNKDVREAYGKYTELQSNALKKAQTVARRNAMKSHPALGIQAVRMGADKTARVAITGWAGDARAMHRWTEIQTRLSQGQELPAAENIEVMQVNEAYDPDQHGTTGDEEILGTPTKEATPDEIERNELIAEIDGVIDLVPQTQVQDLRYDPATNTADELRAIKVRISNIIDAQNQ